MKVLLRSLPLLAALCAIGSPLTAQEIALSVISKGIEIDAGDAGKFVINPPTLTLIDGKTEKPAFEATSESEAVAKFPSGVVLDFSVKGGEITWHIQNGDESRSLMFDMLIPIKFNTGGKLTFGDVTKEFPAELGDKHIATALGRDSFSLQSPVGAGFTITARPNWQAVQDNREYGWSVFVYQFLYDLKASDKTSFTIQVSPLTAP